MVTEIYLNKLKYFQYNILWNILYLWGPMFVGYQNLAGSIGTIVILWVTNLLLYNVRQIYYLLGYTFVGKPKKSMNINPPKRSK